MKQKTFDFLEAHKSEQHSTITEDAKWRQENEVWLKWSRGIALSIVAYMQANSLSRSDIANKLGVSPQYVSRILSGTTNFSFKSIAEIDALFENGWAELFETTIFSDFTKNSQLQERVKIDSTELKNVLEEILGSGQLSINVKNQENAKKRDVQKSSDEVEPVEEAESVDDVEPIDEAENADEIEPVDEIESADDVEPIEEVVA